MLTIIALNTERGYNAGGHGIVSATDGTNNPDDPIDYDSLDRADLTQELMIFAETHEYGRMLCARAKIGFDDFDATEDAADYRYLQKQRNANARVGFVFGSYHGKCWWYELLDLIRKLVLNGLMVFVGEGTAAQVTDSHQHTILMQFDLRLADLFLQWGICDMHRKHNVPKNPLW